MAEKLQGARHIISWGSGLFRTTRLAHAARMPLLLPLYHTVSNHYLPHVSPLYSFRNTALFEEDLEFLLKHFQPISLHDLKDHPDPNKGFDRPVFHLTFDDGLREVFDVVWPILLKFGITATLFVNPAFLDNKELFYRHKAALLLDNMGRSTPQQQAELKALLLSKALWQGSLEKSLKDITYPQREILDKTAEILAVDFQAFLTQHQPYLTTAQINHMMDEGLTLGAHSMDHPTYSHIPVPAQILQTQDSLAFVQKQFGVRYKAFAFPFTDDGVKDHFFDSMYQYGVDLSFGTAGLKTEQWPLHLHRLPMEVGQTTAETIVNTEYLYYLMKRPFGKNNLKRS